jgi:hypothetical protein
MGWTYNASATSRVPVLLPPPPPPALRSLPGPVADFLSDPGLVVLGFAWDSSDEGKMTSTFGAGRARFRRFLDLQASLSARPEAGRAYTSNASRSLAARTWLCSARLCRARTPAVWS